jgi:hypothetical protein
MHVSVHLRTMRRENEHTAFLEYALSSASVRASTNRRRRLGRLDGYVLLAIIS